MSEKNEGLVRRFIDEVWNKGNMQMIDELIASDYVNHDPIDPGRGLQAVRDHVTKYRSAFPDCRLDIEECFSTGDRVVTRFRYNGTHTGALEGIAPTGRRVTGVGTVISRLMNDKLQEEWTVWDALGLMQQLGVVTLPGKAAGAGM